jgi:hypothetical protein
MNTVAKLALLALGCCSMQLAHADRLDRSDRQLDRSTRTESAPRAPSVRAPVEVFVAVEQAPAPAPSWTLDLGIAYEHDQDGTNGFATPFALAYSAPQSHWIFQLSGDGFGRVGDDGDHATGFNDVSLLVANKQKTGNGFSFREGLEVNAPAGGQLGSTHFSEDLQLAARYQPESLGVALTGVIARDEAREEGVSQYSQSASAKVIYDFDGGSELVGQFKRSFPSGAKPRSKALVEYDFPIGSLTGILVASHGLIEGHHDTAAEFDIEFTF